MTRPNERAVPLGKGAPVYGATTGKGIIDPASCRLLVMRMTDDTALLLVDIQNDFCDGGALAVPSGAEVVPIANRLAATARWVVITQDWHPPGHRSFASSHPGRQPFDVVEMPYGPQVLWPDHCVEGTEGAELHRDLDARRADLILRKGTNPDVDSYSAFYETDRITKTGLAGALRERGVRRVVLAGLALDYCVAYSAVDARRVGFEAVVVEDACRAIDVGGSLESACTLMAGAGVTRVAMSDMKLS